ncbi:YCF48-related protein [Haliea sp. E1-2-M8]|uniref:WD40/YVTN/BNR-like repeat-containing protein n=1 Tax=Haliea sp. E1-2-M8 TaxID=3064706 RepID=UPI002720E97B|nr:YCF48-related protein [Haliea sp. E1-2-M8]MDO8863322.1 YCF48-related protein [Haliea sp. E1-2-M8]
MACLNALARPLGLAALALCCLLPAQLRAAEDFAFLPAVTFDDPTSMQLLDIARAGDRLVAVGERGVIILSDDDGASWRQAPVPVSVALTALHFPQPELGWAVGHGGTILHSNDGGESWSLQFDGNDANRQYLAWSQKRVGMLEDALAETEDEAQLEELEYALEDARFAVEDASDAIDIGPADPFLDVLFLDASNGFAVGAYGMLYRTHNGGSDWEIAIAGIDNAYRYHYYALAAGADGRLYLSGEAGLLYYSGDTGSSWERVDDLYDGSLFGIAVLGGKLYAYGLRGHVFRSLDGGVSWEEVDNPERYSLYGGTKLADGQVLMVGSGGLVLATKADGGGLRGWRHPSRSSLSSAVQTASGDILLVGMAGLLPLSEAEPL